MAIDKSLVKEKLENIGSYVRELEGVIKFSEKEILADYVKLRALERIFQLIVDEMVHLNLHFIAQLSLKGPSDFQSSFEIIAIEGEILPYEFAIKISPIVGLRNRLVHRYEEINGKFFVEQVKKEYKDFAEYINFIKKYIEKENNGEN